MIPLLYNHEAKFPIINNNTVLLLPFLLHACCRFYCIIVAILYVSLLADFTVFVLSDYKAATTPEQSEGKPSLDSRVVASLWNTSLQTMTMAASRLTL